MKFTSLVGKDGIVQSFKDISLADNSAADLWAQVDVSHLSLPWVDKASMECLATYT